MGSDSEINNLVLYDGVCMFCNSSINFILDHEKNQKLTFAPLQSDLGQNLLKEFDFPLNYTDSLLFVSNDKISSHSTAAFKIAGYLKSPWQWISLFGILPSFLTDFFYNLIAKHRYRIMGKADACLLPTPATRARFLE